MKILVIGGTGTIGQAIVKELSSRHSVISAGHKSGDIKVDITNSDSIKKMYHAAGAVDAVIIATGIVHFGKLVEMSGEQQYLFSEVATAVPASTIHSIPKSRTRKHFLAYSSRKPSSRCFKLGLHEEIVPVAQIYTSDQFQRLGLDEA